MIGGRRDPPPERPEHSEQSPSRHAGWIGPMLLVIAVAVIFEFAIVPLMARMVGQ